MSLLPTLDPSARPHAIPHRARSTGHPYTPGMFDALIDRPVLEQHSPAEIRGVSIELSASGRGVLLAEALNSGGPAARYLLTLEEPYSVFMRLSDGREVWIEVRAVELVPDEDRAPWEGTPEEPNLLAPNAPTRYVPGSGRFACPDFRPAI